MIFQKIGLIERTYRHAKRYRQILAVLIKFGFEDLVTRLNVENYVEVGLHLIMRERLAEVEKMSLPERVRHAVEELGPTFIKCGQILSTHDAILPPEFHAELEHLQDRVESFPSEEARGIIEEELERPVDELFARFDDVPLAAASIGQVHRARLHSGEEVVVKVQRPRIRVMIEVDTEIMFHIATLMENHLEGWEVHRPTEAVKEFARVIEQEVDYTNEAANIERFAGMFADDPNVYVPRVYREFSTDRVLTMEYVDGIKPTAREALLARNLDPVVIADRGFRLILEQVFQYGYFHADPHPGNLFVLPGNVMCFLDFGMMGQLSRRERENFTDLVMAIALRDEVRGREIFLRITYWEEEPDADELEKAISSFMNQHFYKSLERMNLGKMLEQIIETTKRFRMRLRPDVLLVIKTFMAVDGVGRMLNPEFDPISLAEPYLRNVQKARRHPRRIVHDLYNTGFHLAQFAGELPDHLRAVFDHLREGTLKIDFQHVGIEPLQDTLDSVSNRLSLAILVGSLVIGSSVIVLSDTPPRWHDIPVIGILGFVAAGLISIALIVSLIRRSRSD